MLAIYLQQYLSSTFDNDETQNSTLERRDTNKNENENNDLLEYMKTKKSTQNA